VGGPKKLWSLKRALYGLRQAPREWYLTFKKALEEMGFKPCPNEPSLYVYNKDGVHCLIPVYVDDMLFACNDEAWLKHFKQQLSTRFEMKDMGEPERIIGMRITRDRPNRKIYLDCEDKIDELLDVYGLEALPAVKTPMYAAKHLSRPKPDEVALADNYSSLLGSLLFISVTCRPDIVFAVNHLASFATCHNKEHLDALYHVARYLKGTKAQKLCLNGEDTELRTVVYSDADWAANADDRLSFSGTVVRIGHNGPVVDWKSKKQKAIASSSAQAEFVALDMSRKAAMGVDHVLKQSESGAKSSILMCGDNQASLKIAEKGHCKQRHIHIASLLLTEMIQSKEIEPNFVRSEENIADIMTKPLGPTLHVKGSQALGMTDLSSLST
jgi:hypothetical protein